MIQTFKVSKVAVISQITLNSLEAKKGFKQSLLSFFKFCLLVYFCTLICQVSSTVY